MPAIRSCAQVLFLPRRTRQRDLDRAHVQPEEAQQLSGIREIWEAKEF